MINEGIKNNKVVLSGEIVSNFEFSHEIFGEGFYTTMIAIERLSGEKDTIPITVSERLVDVKAEWEGVSVDICGRFSSYNKHENGIRHLELRVFATGFGVHIEEFDGDFENKNHISLDGYICKEPKYRKTPLGREITDILLAVNRKYGKSDYIPCIAWERNAVYTGDLEVGTRLQIEGRIQSREYQKRIEDGVYETRTAYEVSVSKLTVVEEKKE